ncbi:hypothetical protein Catovirus_1_631 [Catovirus CTV1]|uniref:Uncharacterized protein n=1 Tax=Catovirus CTV1 TaxID=1977631 RepID=A0A1V0SA65_9VIRU|nr:hypothetical protein Catovirus_1_631 [Catovirus CTV1]
MTNKTLEDLKIIYKFRVYFDDLLDLDIVSDLEIDMIKQYLYNYIDQIHIRDIYYYNYYSKEKKEIILAEILGNINRALKDDNSRNTIVDLYQALFL